MGSPTCVTYAFLRVETHVGFFLHDLLPWNVLKGKVAFPVSTVMNMGSLFDKNPIQKNDGEKVEKREGRGNSVRGAGLAPHITGGPPGKRFRRYGKWPKVPENSSDLDDFWTELIVMTFPRIHVRRCSDVSGGVDTNF